MEIKPPLIPVNVKCIKNKYQQITKKKHAIIPIGIQLPKISKPNKTTEKKEQAEVLLKALSMVCDSINNIYNQ
jgi:hypothetical protein